MSGNPAIPSPWLTVKESASYARVGTKTLYRAIQSGRLRVAVVGRSFRLQTAWIDSWLEASRQPQEVVRRVG